MKMMDAPRFRFGYLCGYGSLVAGVTTLLCLMQSQFYADAFVLVAIAFGVIIGPLLNLIGWAVVLIKASKNGDVRLDVIVMAIAGGALVVYFFIAVKPIFIDGFVIK